MQFTEVEQKAHRLELARHLSRHVRDSAYNHNNWKTCALGRAARRCMAGMSVKEYNVPMFSNLPALRPHEVADIVFGEGTFRSIFDCFGRSFATRKDIIKLLREY